MSFVDGSSYHEQLHRSTSNEAQRSPPFNHHSDFHDSRRPLTRSISDEPSGSNASYEENGGSLKKSQTLHLPSAARRNSRAYDVNPKSPSSPGLSLRDMQADADGSQFPLTNIDNPNDIAQELSNLQALRRMSMDVGNSIDPDMPPMGLSAMPVIAPSGDDDENDPSRLLWVPARVHPELAPTEFKSFLEKRVQSIRRRSGDLSLSTDDKVGNRSAGSLSRRKSMLSRQIDNSGGKGAVGYVDGAERLERKRSSAGSHSPELSLDELVKDPTKVVQKFAQESQSAPGGEGSTDDMPILPMAPGMGLRRSTRTTYRKGGSLRSGDRVPFSKRLAQRQQDGDSPELPSSPSIEAPKGHGLARVQSEPIAENYSRPTRTVRRQQHFSQESPASLIGGDGAVMDSTESRVTSPPPAQDQLPPRTSSSAESTGTDDRSKQNAQYSPSFPQRSSSQNNGPSAVEPVTPQAETVAEEQVAAQLRRRSPPSNAYSPSQPNQQTVYTQKPPPQTQPQSYSDSFGTSSSALMSGDSSRTDNLTLIPTFNQTEKRSDKKSKKDKDDDTSSTSSKSGSAWKWFKGVTDDKDKKKDESKRSKAKALVEKVQDNARLDVIQTSIDKTAAKGRESLVLDRDNIDSKLLEERKKESHRKSDSKKDKDGSIFSSIFGGSKRKEEKERSHKRTQHLHVPEQPAYKPMQPDIDYNWTRFPLLEERAIYRMAHIKLANPRRSLLSQVLLSNFMYSYLAIVQAMHPQMNVPTSPQQKRLEEEARRKRQEQDYQEHQDDDAENSLDQYNFDYHRVSSHRDRYTYPAIGRETNKLTLIL